MNKAAQLSNRLGSLDIDEFEKAVERSTKEALSFCSTEDVLCIMHNDGSVNFLDIRGNGVMTGEVISAENILRVLLHYRPFKEVFKGNIQ
jgi:hypothetical protein